MPKASLCCAEPGTFGHWLRTKREALGISGCELARRMQVDRVKHWEANQRRPNAEALAVIAAFFDESVESLESQFPELTEERPFTRARTRTLNRSLPQYRTTWKYFGQDQGLLSECDSCKLVIRKRRECSVLIVPMSGEKDNDGICALWKDDGRIE